MKKNVLITGGAGFVGSNLALFLKEKLSDHNIVCYDNLIRKGSELNVSRLEDKGIQFIKGDVRDKAQLLALPRVDALIECSAEPSVLAAYEDPQYTIDTNLIGTVNCLELAKRDKADFLFLSTSRVYPIDAVSKIPFEELPTRFDWTKEAAGTGYSYQGIQEGFSLSGVRSLYGTTKLCSEHIIMEFLAMYDLKGVVDRCGIIAGPWQMGKVDQGIIGYWVASHIYERDLSYIGFGGQGKQVRDAVHIDDLCELILQQMVGLDKVGGKTFNVGGGRKNSFSLQELTQMVQERTGKKFLMGSDKNDRKGDIRIYITDNSYIEKEIGWGPTKDIESIVGDTFEWVSSKKKELESVLL